jgi:hypothetical protein
VATDDLFRTHSKMLGSPKEVRPFIASVLDGNLDFSSLERGRPQVEDPAAQIIFLSSSPGFCEAADDASGVRA